ncbi:MAG: TspO/MBR family protein [Candidatus Omnitrophica bacterium ADurb.Bin277]|nr:MAG: TspO/MBR family protein [Candidatus Omnitrophica bacterium ADurb.Bin277]
MALTSAIKLVASAVFCFSAGAAGSLSASGAIPEWYLYLFLWAAILATIGRFSRDSISAAVLLIPYLLWVTFGGVPNLGIVLLNP